MDTTASAGPRSLTSSPVSEGSFCLKTATDASCRDGTFFIFMILRFGSREWRPDSYQTDRHSWAGEYSSQISTFRFKVVFFFPATWWSFRISQQDFDHLRSLCYAHVDVFILCFSLVDPVSFDNITSKWIPQIRAGNQRSPIVLVGTQSDLRHSVDVLIHLHQWNTKPVHFRKARRMAQRIRACDYVECSALTQHNLKDVFDSAVWAAIKHKKSTTGCKKLNLYKQLRDICTHGLKKIFKYIWHRKSDAMSFFYFTIYFTLLDYDCYISLSFTL